MFFPERIHSIKPNDKVLEIGPGATPYFRSDVFLEKEYDSEKELIAQSGHVGILHTEKRVVKYSGEIFPFEDNEFNYVVCSHVLEHVDDVELFLSEVQRVAKRGYLEFPTVYYDYVYNFPEHLNFLFFNHDVIFWMKKVDSGLNKYAAIQKLFYRSLELEYYDFVDTFKDYFFQGFEWENIIKCEEVEQVDKLTHNASDVIINKHKVSENIKVSDEINYDLPFFRFIKYKIKKKLNEFKRNIKAKS